ncbi:MAG: tetratricopeptide repeat protein, partial [candidate division Zixibacteria bacterium]|nr:tetratricopeptide repeat protein [candidate division Zixibacteria bacterium]
MNIWNDGQRNGKMILRYDNRDFGPNERHGATGQGDQDWAKTLENLMSLARGAADAFDFDRALGYLNSMEDIWDSKGLPEFSLDMRFEMHRAKGKAYASLGKLDDAIEEYQKILCFCRDSAHLTVKAETFGQIGQLLGKQGDHDRALGYIQRAIGAHRRLRDKAGMCRALRNLGVSYIELGEFEEAELTYHNAIALAEELGERLLYADLVNNLGAIRNMRGDWRQALEHYRESLDIYTAENEIRKSAYTKNNVAITLTEQGLTDDALICFEEAHEIATQIKDASLLLIVDINLADLYLKKGRADLAQAHCIKAERYLLENQLNNGHMVEVHKIAGKIASENNQHEPALQRFDQAYRLASEIGTQYLEAEVLLERGTLLRKMGRHFDALNDLEASYNTYNSLKADGKREKTEEVIHSIESLYLDVFDSMGRDVDQKDPYTKGHSDRVAAYSKIIAEGLDMGVHLAEVIRQAALLHDIG